MSSYQGKTNLSNIHKNIPRWPNRFIYSSHGDISTTWTTSSPPSLGEPTWKPDRRWSAQNQFCVHFSPKFSSIIEQQSHANNVRRRRRGKRWGFFNWGIIHFTHHISVDSSPIREQPPLSHSLQPPTEDDGSGSSAQTQFRFQEPVVPEDHSTSSPVHTRELSIVQVKWDSERKRRQGYFAQEEGSEKSPFRHYNKANCDFESWVKGLGFFLFLGGRGY